MARVRRRPRARRSSRRSPTSIAATSRSSTKAWEWATGETPKTEPRTRPGNFQATPLMIGDTLFLSTSYNRVIALDANTGRELWAYDPKRIVAGPAAERHRIRAPWRGDVDGRQAAANLHQQPLESHRARRGDGTADSRRSATRASSISRASSTRNGKQVNKLHYTQTSPPVVWRDLVIVGNGVADTLVYPNDPPGDVQAFDVKTGKRAWSFSPVPQRQARRRRRDVGERVVEDDRPHERLGAVQRRRSARADLSPGEHAEQRLVRRCAQGQQSLRRIHRVPRGEERAQGLAFPDGASRSVGLRHPSGSRARNGSDRRAAARHRRRPDEDGLSVRVRSRERQTDLADRRALGAGERRARRAGGAVAAVSDEAEAVRQAGIRLRRSHRLHARASERARSRPSRTIASVRSSRRRRSAARS